MGINLVIIAAIALLVLVIIGMIVTGGGRNLSEGTRSCVAQGGQCLQITDIDDPSQYTQIDASGCNTGYECYRYNYG